MSTSLETRSVKLDLWAKYQNYQRVVVGAAAVIVVLFLWQMIGVINAFLVKYLSSPVATVGAGWKMIFEASFWSDISISSLEFVLGFLAAVVVGLILGVSMGLFKRISYLMEPLIMALNATPRMALIPILLVWLGIGIASKVAVIFLGVVIPVTINTMVGIQSVDSVLLRAAKSFGARKRDVYFKILLPGSVPAIMMGIRLGLGRGILGMIVAEMYVSIAGVGHTLMLYGQSFSINELMFVIILVSLVGFLLVSAVGKLEKRLGHWKFNE